MSRVRLWSAIDFMCMSVFVYRYTKERNDSVSDNELQVTTVSLIALMGIEAVCLLFITDQERAYHLPPSYFGWNVCVNVVTLYVIMVYYILEVVQGKLDYRWIGMVAVTFNLLRVNVLHKLHQRMKLLHEVGDLSLIDLHPAESV